MLRNNALFLEKAFFEAHNFLLTYSGLIKAYDFLSYKKLQTNTVLVRTSFEALQHTLESRRAPPPTPRLASGGGAPAPSPLTCYSHSVYGFFLALRKFLDIVSIKITTYYQILE